MVEQAGQGRTGQDRAGGREGWEISQAASRSTRRGTSREEKQASKTNKTLAAQQQAPANYCACAFVFLCAAAVSSLTGRYLTQEVGVHHIDLNFGCPVRKVTSRGGGSALPLRPRLFRRLVAAAVAAAGPDVPVTVKLRMGLTQELLTFKQVGWADMGPCTCISR